MTTASAPYTSELAAALAPDVLERLLRYVRIDTQSDRAHAQSPSTPGQLELGRLLVAELHGLGLADAAQDANGFVTATLAGNVPDAPVIGLLAHLDTSPDESGTGVEPLVHSAYDGGVIALPRRDTLLDPERMPELSAKVGHDLVTSSGDTLLGADDKAGMAEVMAAVAHLSAHPELPRATVRVGFTPDEEIGKGAHLFDIEAFGAECAYTLDGSEAGEFTDETFNAASADLTIHGVEVHPGFATGKLVNAARLAGRVLAALPQDRLTRRRPQGARGSSTSTRSRRPPARPRSARSCATSTSTGWPSTSRCCGAPPRRSWRPSRARDSRSRSSTSTRTCASTSTAIRTFRWRPRRRCGARASSPGASRSAAGRTARS
jgi:tripeptide aminopeptidase